MNIIAEYIEGKHVMRDINHHLICPKCQAKKLVTVGGELWATHYVCGGCLAQLVHTPSDMGQTLEVFQEVDELPGDGMIRYQAHETLRHHFELAKAKHPNENWADFDNDLALEKGFVIDAMIAFTKTFQQLNLLPKGDK